MLEKPNLDNLQRLAEQGDAEAAYQAASCLYAGVDTEPDHRQAFTYFLQAADAGIVEAQANVGVMYLFGDGVEQNEQSGLQYTLKAATAGNAAALYNAGICYQQGKGTNPNIALANAYLHQAAAVGCEPAQQALQIFEAKQEARQQLPQTQSPELARKKQIPFIPESITGLHNTGEGEKQQNSLGVQAGNHNANAAIQQKIVVMNAGGDKKSLAIGVLLTIFFGPLGLFYASIIGGLIMLVIAVLFLLFGIFTFGLGFFLEPIIVHPICVIWAIISINRHNKQINEQMNKMAQQL